MIRAIVLLLLAVTASFAEKKAIRPPKSPTAGPYSAGIIAGDFLYISGHVGPEPGGGFAPGDVKTQTRRCLDLVRKVLTEAGLDWPNVVSATLYLTDIRTLDAADAAWREAISPPYPARTEIESQLLIPEALVEVSAVAFLGNPQAAIYLRPPGWPEPKRPLSYAVLSAGTLFFSAIRPVDPGTGKLAGDTIQSQTEQVLRNQAAVLTTAKMKPAGVKASRIFLADASLLRGFDAIYQKAAPSGSVRSIAQMTPFEPGHLVQAQPVAVSVTGKPASSEMVYIAGMTGHGPDGRFARNDIKAQTRQALQSIEKQLASHGLTFANAVDAVVWLRDPRHAAEMNAVYREMVKPFPPARATVRLAPMDQEALIEITMAATK